MSATENLNTEVPKFMKARAFAKYTGLPERVVRDLMKSGDLVVFKQGRNNNFILVESYRDLASSPATQQ